MDGFFFLPKIRNLIAHNYQPCISTMPTPSSKRKKVQAASAKNTPKKTATPSAKPKTTGGTAKSSTAASKPAPPAPKANNTTNAPSKTTKKSAATKNTGVYYPPVGFCFIVTIGKAGELPRIDNQFKEVTGLSLELETEDVEEGGENRFVHKLPKRVKNQEIVLKRGLVTSGSALTDWCKEVLEQQKYKMGDISLDLVGVKDAGKEEYESLMRWSVVGAMPVKWEISDFNSTENEIVIESITFSYQYYTTGKTTDKIIKS